MTDATIQGNLDPLHAGLMERMPTECPVYGLSGPIFSDDGWWVWNGVAWLPNNDRPIGAWPPLATQ